jgi:hypothetical protein
MRRFASDVFILPSGRTVEKHHYDNEASKEVIVHEAVAGYRQEGKVSQFFAFKVIHRNAE